jgi:hypothetical protein
MRVRIQAFFSYLEMMNFDAKVDAGAGGILASNAFPGIETESVWIATFTSFIIWLLALVITPLAATADSNGKLHIVGLRYFIHFFSQRPFATLLVRLATAS